MPNEEVGLPHAFEAIADGDPLMELVGQQFPSEVDDGPDCCSDEAGDYVCTRPAGHDGPHVAHGSAGSAFAWWPQGL